MTAKIEALEASRSSSKRRKVEQPAPLRLEELPPELLLHVASRALAVNDVRGAVKLAVMLSRAMSGLLAKAREDAEARRLVWHPELSRMPRDRENVVQVHCEAGGRQVIALSASMIVAAAHRRPVRVECPLRALHQRRHPHRCLHDGLAQCDWPCVGPVPQAEHAA